MGNIGPVTRNYDVLPLGLTTIADMEIAPAFTSIIEPSALERATDPSPGVPAPQPMPAPYPDPTPEPAPTPEPSPAGTLSSIATSAPARISR